MGYAFGGKPAYDQRHRVRCDDGWPLALYEYHARGEPRASTPVLLVHGTNCRYRVYDLGGGFGLAPYLAARGFHVFALDLRGRGLSAPRAAYHRAAALLRRGWTLTDFMKHDLPRAFEVVLARSGAASLDYVGHSMGGMLAFELLARTHDPRVRRVVAIASGDARALLLPEPKTPKAPATGLCAPRPPVRVNLGVVLAPFALSTRYAPIHWGAKLGAVALPVTPRWALTSAVNPDNVEPLVLQRFLWHALAGISAKKYWSFGAMYRRARRGPSPHTYVHPTLLISGAADLLMPASRVRALSLRLAHAEVDLVECSRAHGFSADYGHTDLLIGKRAEREVFPHVEGFLRAQHGARRAASL